MRRKHIVSVPLFVLVLGGMSVGLQQAWAHEGSQSIQRSAETQSALKSGEGPSLSSVDPNTLRAKSGIVLGEPQGTASIGAEMADRIAENTPIGGQVRETVLARLETPLMPTSPENGKLAWIVSMMPAGGVHDVGGQVVHVDYAIVAVDAVTGQLLKAVLAGH